MIRILSENNETAIEIEGKPKECINESLNIASSVILYAARDVTDDVDDARLLAVDMISISTGNAIWELYGGDLDNHVEAVRGFIKSHINPEEQVARPEPNKKPEAAEAE